MLPHHQPLVVAEQFATLTAFAPGRIDLGLGRSTGFTPPVRRALRETERDFAADLAELRGYLTGCGAITVHSQTVVPVTMQVLTSRLVMLGAADLGLTDVLSC